MIAGVSVAMDRLLYPDQSLAIGPSGFQQTFNQRPEPRLEIDPAEVILTSLAPFAHLSLRG
jgi:hypothetical protein